MPRYLFLMPVVTPLFRITRRRIVSGLVFPTFPLLQLLLLLLKLLMALLLLLLLLLHGLRALRENALVFLLAVEK